MKQDKENMTIQVAHCRKVFFSSSSKFFRDTFSGRLNFYFIRHGQSIQNVGEAMMGEKAFAEIGEDPVAAAEFIDAPLTKIGIQQAESSKFIYPFDHLQPTNTILFSSVLLRAIQTAHFSAPFDFPLKLYSSLREATTTVDGMSYIMNEEHTEKHKEHFENDILKPIRDKRVLEEKKIFGNSYGVLGFNPPLELYEKVIPDLANLAIDNQTKNVVFVGHSLWFKTLSTHLNQNKIKGWKQFSDEKVPNGGVVHFTYNIGEQNFGKRFGVPILRTEKVEL